MSTQRIMIVTDKPEGTFESECNMSAGRLEGVVNLSSYFAALAGGVYRAKLEVSVGMQVAKGTFTLNAVLAAHKVSVNGVEFTCMASGAVGNQFNKGADDVATAANLAAAINASVTDQVKKAVTASSNAKIVTLESTHAGVVGNIMQIASSQASVVASGKYLTGGDDGTSQVIDLL